jgi:hypothetical protein
MWRENMRKTAFKVALISILALSLAGFHIAEVTAEGREKYLEDFEKKLWNCVHLIDLHRSHPDEIGIWSKKALGNLREQVLLGFYRSKFNNKVLSSSQLSRTFEGLGTSYELAKQAWQRYGLTAFSGAPQAREIFLTKCYRRSYSHLKKYLDRIAKQKGRDNNLHADKPRAYDGP